MAPLFLVAYLLATGGGRGGRVGGREGRRRGGGASSVSDGRGRGRNRYARDGTKRRGPSKSETEGKRREELHPLPPLTTPGGTRPSYFTCRHNYEDTLMDEIRRHATNNGAGANGEVIANSPYPGLVRVEDERNILPASYDPVYALQCMPECVVVTAESMKGIARAVIAALLGTDDDGSEIDQRIEMRRQMLRDAERGSLTIHPLVPGMCKAQTNPVMQNRATKVGEEVSTLLKKIYPAARRAALDENANRIEPKERYLLQVMLQSPDIAVASISKCQPVGPGKQACWPNAIHPLGLAKVDIEERMPSSAYRKLMEGIKCMGICPTASSTVVDLGACPGGWTAVMRRYFDCSVISVDRSELESTLMKDSKVEFVTGDAFAYEPPADVGDDTWMISDVIAYPERATELLNNWCRNRWASNLIVTMKFQGEEPDLDELGRAVGIVKECGYGSRVKHFFNNKNEVTFMVWENSVERRRMDLDVGALGAQMYPS
ncbi:hypothetical protein ACHAXT_012029 [Thalassiosira profunda]